MGLFLAACLVLLNVMIAGICPELSATYSTAPAANWTVQDQIDDKKVEEDRGNRAEYVGSLDFTQCHRKPWMSSGF